MLTVLRTVADMQKVYVYALGQASETAMMAMRGPASEIALGQWLIGQLDVPSADRSPAPHDYPVPDELRSSRIPGEVIRVHYLSNPRAPEEMNQILTALRTTGEIQKTFVYLERNAVIYRGAPDQLAVATLIIETMDQPVHH